MKFEVDIKSYLSDDEIRNIIEDEIRQSVPKRVNEMLHNESDFNRIISNLAYQTVRERVDANLPETMDDMLIEKIPQIVKELSAFTVFRKKDAWDREESKGWTILQKVLDDSEPLIRKRVEEIIGNLEEQAVYDFILDKLEGAVEDIVWKVDKLNEAIGN